MRTKFVEGALLDGRFRTHAPLNHGSFGMVFKAYDTWMGDFVALKCLTKSSAAANCPPAFAVDDRSEELAIHRRVGNHPNIVNLIHHFETEHHIYLVLEYCANGDLYEAIRVGRGPGQTEHVRECMLQLVDAVEHMHSKGLYHRDIKPENIFLSSSGTMKLGDFGLATMDSRSYESAVGSDRYMAPEQFDPSTTGYLPAKADIWALGICLLNMLFSRNPFAQPTLSDPLFSDFANDRQTLFDVFPNMSQDTFEVLIHCLAIDPKKRSLAAVKDALKRVVSFTTVDESLDEFCAEEAVATVTASKREPLRTPSFSTPQLDQNGAFPWAKALAMSPPVGQLSPIPDTPYSEDLFPSPDNSSQDWFSVKPDSDSVASFVDSGLGVSLKSTNLKPEPTHVNRSNPLPISGSLPVSFARPIPSMSGVFGKKRELVSKSWSDMWDEEEEELGQLGRSDEAENVMQQPRGRNWPEESDGRDTPRVGLAEVKNPDTFNNSRNRSPPAARALDECVSEDTLFIFEEHESTAESTPKATPATPASPATPRYSPPKRTATMDKWAMLGEMRRGALPPPVTGDSPPQTTPTDQTFGSIVPPRKRNRAGSWRRNLNWHGFDSTSREKDNREPWSTSKDWRQHPAPAQQSVWDDRQRRHSDAFGWVWRSGGFLHL